MGRVSRRVRRRCRRGARGATFPGRGGVTLAQRKPARLRLATHLRRRLHGWPRDRDVLGPRWLRRHSSTASISRSRISRRKRDPEAYTTPDVADSSREVSTAQESGGCRLAPRPPMKAGGNHQLLATRLRAMWPGLPPRTLRLVQSRWTIAGQATTDEN